MKNDKRNTITFSLLCISLLLIAVVGATFAYFSVTAQVTEQSLYVETTSPTGLIYDGAGLLSLNNAIPGDRTSVKTFTVENPGAINQIYSLSLHIDDNGFTASNAPEQMIMYIGYGNCSVDESSSEPLTCDSISKIDLTDGDDTRGSGQNLPLYEALIEPYETQEYYIYLEFVDTGEEQDENKNISFGAHIALINTSLIRDDQLPYDELSLDNKVKNIGDFIPPLTLAKYILQNEPIVTSGTGLYHHTSDTTASDYVANSAEDDSYRYGGSGDTIKNWICFGGYDGTNCSEDFKWRIVNILSDGTIKIVKSSFIGHTSYNGNDNSWEDSGLKSYINGDMLWNNSRYMNDTMKQMIVMNPVVLYGGAQNGFVKAKALYDQEKTSTLISSSPVVLLNSSDLGYSIDASYWDTPLNQYPYLSSINWLARGTDEWGITPCSIDSSKVFYMISGQSGPVDISFGGHSVRPVVFLKSNVKHVNGDGSQQNMYIIS